MTTPTLPPPPDSPRELSPAPCSRCGYNGPGYYQPDTHPCAALLPPDDAGARQDCICTPAEIAQFGTPDPLCQAAEHPAARPVVEPRAQEDTEAQDVGAILQSVFQMIGLPAFRSEWFDDRGDWDFGQIRKHGLDERVAQIRSAEKALAASPLEPRAAQTDYVDWGNGELLAMTALDDYEDLVADGLPKSTSVVFRIHQLGRALRAALQGAEAGPRSQHPQTAGAGAPGRSRTPTPCSKCGLPASICAEDYAIMERAYIEAQAELNRQD